MKILLVILSGAVATLGLYASGFVTAMAFLSAEPTPVWKPSRDAGGVWTLEPVAVNGADQDFERLPARPVAGGSLVASAAAAGESESGNTPAQPVDETRTASIGGEADAADGPGTDAVRETAPALDMAHVEWCQNRYRSYRVEDNSYTPYSGGRRACVSPHFRGSAGPSRGESTYAQADAPLRRRTYISSQHIQSCFDRYRSYRPSDNSYQPYGGGPRRQCR